MNSLIAQIEKMKPFFEKVSRNIYLRAIKDGFVASMPIILFSSIFLLIAYVPNIFGFEWSKEVESLLMKPYNYTMGVVGLLVAGTTAKSLTDSINRSLPPTNQINFVSTMLASIAGFLLLASDQIEKGFASGFLGTKGLLTSFLVAFIVVNIYKVCVKNNVTIRMPEEVPPNIAQVFKDVIPLTISIVVLYAFDIASRTFLEVGVAESIVKVLAPLFSAADGYVGITIIFGAIALFWFLGIHGPSIVEPAIAAIQLLNIENNFQAVQAGEHADKIITPGAQYFIVTMGGTGATLVVPFMFMWLAKSKRNKAVGRAAVVPTSFGVNEPILFGAPLVLNPVFFVPFILAPIANIWVFKFFVDTLHMNSFIVNLPWTTPGPIGIIMGTGVGLWSIVLAITLIVVDVLIYYPFLKVYDKQILEEELKGKSNEEAVKEDVIISEKEVEKQELTDQINVLVLCAGGGTSGLLANALTKAAKENNEPLTAAAGSYGAHREILDQYQMVILAPQVASNYADMKEETDKLGIKLVKTEGAQYIQLTRDGKGSLQFIKDELSK